MSPEEAPNANATCSSAISSQRDGASHLFPILQKKTTSSMRRYNRATCILSFFLARQLNTCTQRGAPAIGQVPESEGTGEGELGGFSSCPDNLSKCQTVPNQRLGHEYRLAAAAICNIQETAKSTRGDEASPSLPPPPRPVRPAGQEGNSATRLATRIMVRQYFWP